MKNLPLSKFIIGFFLVIIFAQKGLSQEVSRHFQADYEAKSLRFGYFLGLTNTYFNVKFNNYFINKDKYYSITSPPTIGIKMGGLANVRLNDYFDFRVLPTVSIYGRRLEYKYVDTTLPDGDPNQFKENTELRETAWFEIPVELKYKSERRGNVRMYVFAGFRYGLETNSVNRKKRQQFVTKTNDLSIEYGTGIEFFREYFKFSPEIHFSHGLVNLVDPISNRNTPLQGVERLTTHTVTLYILFE